MNLAFSESKKGLIAKQRRVQYMPVDKMSNFISCFGSGPNEGVLADTCMMHDFTDTLKSRFDKQTLQVTFPQVLDNMLGDRKNDCKWEFWKSNQI